MPRCNRVCNRLCLVGVIGLTLARGGAASGQTAPTSKTGARLATIVRLALGETTLAEVAKALSDQTGVSVSAAPYLRERKLVVQMENLSADQALGALMALNGWQLYETQEGAIVITRPPRPTPLTLSEVPAALHAVLPRDIQQFLGVGIAAGMPKNVWERRMQAIGMSQAVIPRRIVEKTERLVKTQLDELAAEQKTADKTKKIPYAKLTPRQRENLLEALVFNDLGFFVSSPGGPLLYDTLIPIQRDFSVAEARFQGGMLSIGSTVANTQVKFFASFGAHISSDKPVKQTTP